MSGYTPLFDSLTRGSLMGRWPDIGLWPIVLSMANKDGIVDCTPEYIATVCGLPLDEVVACLDRFCAPDPMSSCKEYEGRRLLRLEDRRGWLVVNHAYYRERARLMAKSAREVESGRNRLRMANRRKFS